MMAGFSSKVMAQITDSKTNHANAQILGAITLTAGQNLEFGGIVPDATGGTVIIDNIDGRTKTGSITLVNSKVIPKSGSYTLTGTGSVPYSITVPTESFDITNTTGTGSQTMTVTELTCSKGTLTAGSVTTAFPSAGIDAFKVGGTLTVGPSQVPGVYTGTFSVTVAY